MTNTNLITKYSNVFIARNNGLNLAHELAILNYSDGFIGTSSGYSTFVTFTKIPYIILNMEKPFASLAGLDPQKNAFPFSKSKQYITTDPESIESLTDLFIKINHDNKV